MGGGVNSSQHSITHSSRIGSSSSMKLLSGCGRLIVRCVAQTYANMGRPFFTCSLLKVCLGLLNLSLYTSVSCIFFLCGDDGVSYDILGYIFSYFHFIWRQIRGNLEKLSMFLGKFCIVFIWVVAIHFVWLHRCFELF